MLNFLEDLNYYFVRNGFIETVEWVMAVIMTIMSLIAALCLFVAMAVYVFHVTTGVVSFDLQTMLFSLMCGVVFIGGAALAGSSLRKDL